MPVGQQDAAEFFVGAAVFPFNADAVDLAVQPSKSAYRTAEVRSQARRWGSDVYIAQQCSITCKHWPSADQRRDVLSSLAEAIIPEAVAAQA